jgi:hypothetical protein
MVRVFTSVTFVDEGEGVAGLDDLHRTSEENFDAVLFMSYGVRRGDQGLRVSAGRRSGETSRPVLALGASIQRHTCTEPSPARELGVPLPLCPAYT